MGTILNMISCSLACSTSDAVSLTLPDAKCLLSVADMKHAVLNKISGGLVTVVIPWDVKNATAEI